MIITCPQCDSRFVVPSTVFMKGGRKVRCASCKHVWFHEEALDRVSGGANAPKISSDNDTPKTKNGIKSVLSDIIEGYKVIAAFAILIIAGYFAYQAINPPLIVGQGLAFDNIIITREGQTIDLKGDIVNRMDTQRGVPSIQIIQYLANDVAGDKLIIAPSKDILQSGEAIEFNATMDNVGSEIINVKVAFFMGTANDVIDETKQSNHE